MPDVELGKNRLQWRDARSEGFRLIRERFDEAVLVRHIRICSL